MSTTRQQENAAIMSLYSVFQSQPFVLCIHPASGIADCVAAISPVTVIEESDEMANRGSRRTVYKSNQRSWPVLVRCRYQYAGVIAYGYGYGYSAVGSCLFVSLSPREFLFLPVKLLCHHLYKTQVLSIEHLPDGAAPKMEGTAVNTCSCRTTTLPHLSSP